jgi:hypothetical protein
MTSLGRRLPDGNTARRFRHRREHLPKTRQLPPIDSEIPKKHRPQHRLTLQTPRLAKTLPVTESQPAQRTNDRGLAWPLRRADGAKPSPMISHFGCRFQWTFP